MNELILIGSGWHDRACIDVIEQIGLFSVSGLVGKNDSELISALGIPIIGTDEDLESLYIDYKYAFIAVGQIKSPEIRIGLYTLLKSIGYKLPIMIAPSAYVSRLSKISNGSIVMHGAIVNSGAKIGNNCIINNQSLIEHGVSVEDHCHIATGAILNGDVSIGKGTFIGSGAIVSNGLTVGAGCVIGAGVTIKTPIDDNMVIKS